MLDAVLIGIVVAAAALAALLSVTLGRSIMRQTKVVAALVCGSIPPIMIAVLGTMAMLVVGGPGSETVGMLAAMLCLIACPICLLVSGGLIFWISEQSES